MAALESFMNVPHKLFFSEREFISETSQNLTKCNQDPRKGFQENDFSLDEFSNSPLFTRMQCI